MAITNAQQYQQLVNKPADGKRPGYRGPGGYQSGKSDKKSSGMSPGRSQAQFGHAGHAGKTEDQAKSDQRLGNDRPDSGPGSNPFAGHNQAEKKGFQKQQEINKQIQEGTFEPPKKKNVLDFFDKRRQAYNIARKLPGAAKSSYNNLVAYRNYLKSQGADLTTIDRLLEGVDEETPIGFDAFQELAYGYTPKGIEDIETLRSMFTDTTRGPFDKITAVPQNYSEFMLTQRNNPNLFAAGDLGNFMNMPKPKDLVNPNTGELYTNAEFEKLKQDIGQDRGLIEGMGGDPTRPDPCKGPNPPAYCFVNQDPTDPNTPPPSTGVFAGIAPRFAGSIFDFDKLRAGAMDGGMIEDTPVGGIMDLESGRQMYFLGKLVKKAKRAVKKIAKSPFGKAALIGLGAGMAGFGPAKGLFASGKGLSFKNFMTNKLFGTLTAAGHPTEAPVRMGGLLNFIKNNPYKSIFAGSTLLGLMGDKDDDGFDIDEYYRTAGLGGQEGIDAIRLQGLNALSNRFKVADGGRINYQEGGDAEPVAKKTMPLIDMDGKEKDYRETGGFVDMGRMERADDVPARLSKNEFVFTADAVRNAGDGDIDKGAEVMYNMMKNLEGGGDVSEESQGLEGARKMFQTSQRLGEVL